MSRDDLYSIIGRSPTPQNHDLARFVSEHAEEIAEALPSGLVSGMIGLRSDDQRMMLLIRYFQQGEIAMRLATSHPFGIHEEPISAFQHVVSPIEDFVRVNKSPGPPMIRDSLNRFIMDEDQMVLVRRPTIDLVASEAGDSPPPVLSAPWLDEQEESGEFYGHGTPPEPLPGTGFHEPGSRSDDRLLSPAEFAARHEPMSPQTARNHIHKKRIIGWRHGPKRWVIPEDQLGVEGYFDCMPALLGHFPSSAIAWHWLNRPNRNTNGATPLARLRGGAEAEVFAAARMYGAGDFT